jgi:hypothetical protein
VLAYEEMDIGLHVSCVWVECRDVAGLGSGNDCRDSSGMRPTPGVGGGWGAGGGLRGLPFGGVQMVPLQL